jgi:ParB family chromosome partitioning protein
MERKTEYRIVDIDKLVPNPFQPREAFEKESLNELADSLKSRGEIQPIVVRKHKAGYQIIAGERRWRAAKLAGMKDIPVLVRATPEEDVLLESLIENLHRLDLSSVERENATYELWKSGRWKTKMELAKMLGKTEHWVTENVSAAEIRKKEKIPADVATRTIVSTATLEREERKQIIEKVRREEIPEKEVREYARVLKKAPAPIKKAVLKPKSRITPRMAEQILKLPEKKQAEAVRQVESLRLDEEEAALHIEAMKVEVPLPPPEELEKVRERYEELQKEIRAKLETPEAKERGELFRNWSSHIAVVGILDSISCPVCKSKKLGWICHGLTIKEALHEAEKKYREDLNKKKHAGEGFGG